MFVAAPYEIRAYSILVIEDGRMGEDAGAIGSADPVLQ